MKYFLILIPLLLNSVHAEISLSDIDTDLTQKQCIKSAIQIMKKVGANENQIFDMAPYVTAEIKDYTYFIICRADKGLAITGELGTLYVGGSTFMKLTSEILGNENHKNKLSAK